MKNEQIVIDDRIVVMLLRIRGQTVRFGIEAPKDVAVHRKEVYEAIKNGKEGLEGNGGTVGARRFV
jgi:carbon storage regulator